MRRGWALLLCAYLLGLVPFSFASELLRSVPSLQMRGAPAVAELAAHGVVAVLCATAGWMVWVRAPATRGVAAVGVAAACVSSLQSLFWTALPRNLAPGEAVPLAVMAIAHAAFWLWMLRGE